jgi:RNA polymerase-binding protein DksA
MGKMAQKNRRAGTTHNHRSRKRASEQHPTLSTSEIIKFKQILVSKRRELMEDADNLRYVSRQFSDAREEGTSSSMPIHAAEAATETWERHFNLGLLENNNSLLREIDEALARIESGKYGICLATGKPISKSRLKAIPWTRYCIEYARQLEMGGNGG